MIQQYFDRNDLGRREEALDKEFLITNESGFYATSSICGCNQRKYHGLLIGPHINDEDHILLSSVDETATIDGRSYNIAIHQYAGIGITEGYQYLDEFSFAPTPKWIYKTGDAVISKELLLSQHGIMIKYSIEEGTGKISLALTAVCFQEYPSSEKSRIASL